eukprot:14739304-Heterocapsa_arctica.AAC.1
MHTKGFVAPRSYIQELVQNFRPHSPQAMDLSMVDTPDPSWYDNTVYQDGANVPEGEDPPSTNSPRERVSREMSRARLRAKTGRATER